MSRPAVPLLAGRRRRQRAVLTVMALASVLGLTAACSTPSPGPTAASDTVNVDAGELQATFQDAAAALEVPGAFMLLRSPEGEVLGSYGTVSTDETLPPRSDHHLRVGSNTKTWTGTVILQLAQEGVLDLDDPIAAYRPDVPNGQNITIEQLLSMRSGLYNYTLDRGLNQAMDEDPERAWDPEDLLAISWEHPPSFAPGEGWEYSNTNTVLLGLVAEQLEGEPLERIFADRLFTPLGLADTLFPARSSNRIPEPYAHGYMFGSNVLTMGTPPALPERMQEQARSGALDPVDRTFDNPSWGWAAGGGISTAHDLADWAEALTDGRLLDEEFQRLRMESPRSTGGDQPASARYGLAIAKFGELYGHTGELPGYNSFMGHDPDRDITLVVWANLAPTPDGRDPATTIARTLVDSIYPVGD
ncbi:MULTISPECIES: serine hydrolase domain-containing protein [Citricoccus]|uniref:serine hydrolase domain-containing protein n=1 Tax=Citricoccus TaxID=169133 RepID=UPI000255EE59|nr:serine hydrolase domain-containing protein [Citricoccus sp. CH26A]